MSDYKDPRYDPRLNPNLDPSHQDYQDPNLPLDAGTGMNWSWVLGGIAALVLLLIAVNYMNRDTQTATTDPTSPAITGQSVPRTQPGNSTTGVGPGSERAPSANPAAPSSAPQGSPAQ